MATRAAVCIGVNRAGSMPSLKAAVKGARDFEAWAKRQGCDTTLLIDDGNTRVSLSDAFDAVDQYVKALTYEQLIIYFSGHGILPAPNTEYWLLSRAPENANEAVNLVRTIEDARNCGVPHVVFVSDACRSSVPGPPLSGVLGGTIFANRGYAPRRGEIDVFYATRPGDPAWEVPKEEAVQRYSGVFTDFLLETIESPLESLVDEVPNETPPRAVVTPRKLKPHLESKVPIVVAGIDLRMRQTPDIQVGSALPQFFAVVDPKTIEHPARALPAAPAPPTIGDALTALAAVNFAKAAPGQGAAGASAARRFGLTDDVERLVQTRGRGRFETRTGFTIHGASAVRLVANGWIADPPFEEPGIPGSHVRMHAAGAQPGRSAVLVWRTPNGVETGTVLAVLPDFIGTIVVDAGCRATSVNYVPSENSSRYAQYKVRAEQVERMKAYAAVASRNGRFVVEGENAVELADRIRVDKGFDPTLGLYAAYAYAQAGRDRDVYSVFGYMSEEQYAVPVLFDVVMLASRYDRRNEVAKTIYAPFAPMLSQGWSLLSPGDPLFDDIHVALRPHLVPSLWTTIDAEGVAIAAEFVRTKGV